MELQTNHEIKCPKCNEPLDHYLKDTLRFDEKMEPVKGCILACPQCNHDLNEFVMQSLNTSFADHEKEISNRTNFIEWEPRFDVGIEIIDKQHHKLVAIINKLHMAVSTGHRDKDFIPSIISELVSYTVEHFQTEEKLQIGTQYPGLEQHRAQHREFINAVATLQHDFNPWPYSYFC